MFEVYSNVLPECYFYDEYNALAQGSGWKFINNSAPGSDALTFWYIDLIDNSFYNSFVFNEIQSMTEQKYELLAVRANGQTYGLCGDFHIDDRAEDIKTFLIYMNPVWDIKWGGATVLHHDNITYTHIPKPNTGILFNSNILHYGSEPTRHCKELRVTVAYKLKLK
jgi:hypothetical protein